MHRVDHKIIRQKAVEIFQSEGLNKSQSNTVVDGLIWSSLRGIDSHGVNLIEHYFKEICSGRINKNPSYQITKSSNNIFTMDADDSFGISASEHACKFLVDKMKDKGVGCIFVINSSHCGALSNAVKFISNSGMVGLGMTHATAKMKTPNNSSAFVGNNPLCVMIKGKKNNFCFDSANSTTSFNEIRRNIGIKNIVPDGSGFNKYGNPTNIASEISFLNPIGDYKGIGLAMVIDLFCGVFTGMPSGNNVSAMFGENLSEKRKLGHFFLAFDIKKFPSKSIHEDVDKYINSFHKNSQNDVLHPGEKEEKSYKNNLKNGIIISDQLQEFLQIKK